MAHVEGTGRRLRRPKQLLDDPKETRKHRQLKEEVLRHTLWRTRYWKRLLDYNDEKDDDEKDDDYDDNHITFAQTLFRTRSFS
jgi:hypothetical protein